MMLTDTSWDDVVFIGGKPACIVGLENDVVHVKYFSNLSDFFVKPLHSSHFYVFLMSGSLADIFQ